MVAFRASIGRITESQILAELIKNGVETFAAYPSGGQIDIVGHLGGGRLIRIQCKTARSVYEGSCVFQNVRMNMMSQPGGRVRYETRQYDDGVVDYFGVYCPDNGGAYLVPREACGAKSTTLRYGASLTSHEGKGLQAGQFTVATVIRGLTGAPAPVDFRDDTVTEARASRIREELEKVTPNLSLAAKELRMAYRTALDFAKEYFPELVAARTEVIDRRHRMKMNPTSVAARVETILQSGLDFGAQGSLLALANLVGVSPAPLKKFMQRYMPDFYNQHWVRRPYVRRG